MRDPVEEHRPEFDRSQNEWGIALAIGFTIIICIVAFILIFIQLEPLLSDFISESDISTPSTEPDTIPTESST